MTCSQAAPASARTSSIFRNAVWISSSSDKGICRSSFQPPWPDVSTRFPILTADEKCMLWRKKSPKPGMTKNSGSCMVLSPIVYGPPGDGVIATLVSSANFYLLMYSRTDCHRDLHGICRAGPEFCRGFVSVAFKHNGNEVFRINSAQDSFVVLFALANSCNSHAKATAVPPPCSARTSASGPAVSSRAQSRCHSESTASQVIGTAPA